MRYFNQRNFKNIDCSISLSVLLACVLTIIAACADASGPLGAPNVIQSGGVSSVKVSLGAPTLALGQSTQATVVATTADGQVVSSQVDFSSQNPSVAAVSSKGVVSALAAGVAVIQAAVGSHAASATLTVKPMAPPTAGVAVVAVTLDSTSLTVGHSAKANATVMDSVGNMIPNQAVTWASLSPAVATVSPNGIVTAVSAGSAMIQAAASTKLGSAVLTVVAVPAVPGSTAPDSTTAGSTLLASHDFEDGTSGPFNDFGVAAIDYPNDPTGSGRGKVARILYSGWAGDPASNDENLEFNTKHHYRYGETIWFKGDVYFPSTVVSGGPRNFNDTRKIIDYFSDAGPQSARLILGREYGGQIVYSAGDCMDGGVFHVDVHTANTGIVLLDDTWYTLEVRMTLNSADNVRDGILEIYVNNQKTPSYRLTTGLGWITEAYPGGSYFNSFRFGTQLTIHYPTDPLWSEYRYWDNVSLSTARIGS
jgi:hypothetical protein